MKIVRSLSTLLARFLISLVFLAGGLSKFLHWHETEKFLMNTLSEWQTYVGFSEDLQYFLSKMVPMTPFLLGVAALFELLGGLSVLLGVKEKLGATLLILFLIPATVLMHQFWFLEGPMREVQLTHFLKNLAILGGLILIVLQGTQESKSSFPAKFG
jgi:uncharacterized membrane protein YphA (DoxX/SURF4 family)